VHVFLFEVDFGVSFRIDDVTIVLVFVDPRVIREDAVVGDCTDINCP